MAASIFHRLLDTFEAKYGGFYELLAQYPATTEKETKRLAFLMRYHERLVASVTGYDKGYDEGFKAAKEQFRG